MNIIKFLTNKGYQLKKNTDGTYSGPCPFCGGTDRFTVFPQSGRWGGNCTCRKCPPNADGKLRSYNFVDLLMRLGSLTKSEAYAAAKASFVVATSEADIQASAITLQKPDFIVWNSFVEALAVESQRALFSEPSNWGLSYLIDNRHLSVETIKSLGLGYISKNGYLPAKDMGFLSETDRVIFKEGIFIPARDANGRIIAVDIRCRPGSESKHYVIRGSRREPEILHGNSRAVILVESFLDAALIWQTCKDLCSVGVLYSAQMKATPEFAAALKKYPVIIYAGDTDEAGRKNFGYWYEHFGARRWLIPARYGKDPCEGVDNGLDVREWITACLVDYPILFPELTVSGSVADSTDTVNMLQEPIAPSVTDDKTKGAADANDSVTVSERIETKRDLILSVSELSQVSNAVEYLSAFSEIALDTETYSEETSKGNDDIPALDSKRNKVRLVTVTAGDRTYVFDIKLLDGAPQKLLELIASKRVVGHNLKFDFESMAVDFGLAVLPKHCFDTMIAEMLISKATEVEKPGKGRFSLATLCNVYLGVHLDKEEQTSDWSGELTVSQIEYAANDTRYLLQLKEALMAELDSLGFSMEVVDTEMSFVSCLSKIELAGIPIDLSGVKDKISELEKDYTREVRNWSAEHNGVNPNSQPQLMALFKSIGLDLPDTSKNTLPKYADNPVVASLMTLRAYKHPLDYLRKTLELAVDGKIFPRFMQIAAPTGRMSSVGLNTQAIPSSLKGLYAYPPTGWSVVKCDYPAIELRIGAVVTHEQNLIACFQEGRDPHSMMAARIKGVDVEAISKDSPDRKKAKAANFGFLYGMGASTFREYAQSYGVSFTLDEAEEFKADYLDLYQSIDEWQKETGSALAKTEDGTLERISLAGRVMRAGTYCSALNYAVQGTGADMIKRAVILIDEAFTSYNLKARIINIVHDDIRVLCPDEEVEQVKAILVEKMGSVADALLPDFKTLPDPEVISSR